MRRRFRRRSQRRSRARIIVVYLVPPKAAEPLVEAAGDGQQPKPTARWFGDAEIDLEAHTVRVGGSPVVLGHLEFQLLDYLVRNAGVALSRSQIMQEVHGYDADVPTERVDLLVRRLRKKLGWEGWIKAVPGYGYRLERP